MLIFLVTLLCTVIIPLKESYKSFKQHDQERLAMFAVYWGIFALIQTITSTLTFLKFELFQLLWTLILVWLYHNQYMGGLYLRDLSKKYIRNLEPVQNIIKKTQTYLGFLGIFEKEDEEEKVKPQ